LRAWAMTASMRQFRSKFDECVDGARRCGIFTSAPRGIHAGEWSLPATKPCPAPMQRQNVK
jgi:hypothetical protein